MVLTKNDNTSRLETLLDGLDIMNGEMNEIFSEEMTATAAGRLLLTEDRALYFNRLYLAKQGVFQAVQMLQDILR